MRAFFLFWVLPVSFFWGWFFSARADLGPGFFSREVFDRTFDLYGMILGMTPDEIGWLVAEALVIDSLIILAIVAYRRRKKIAAAIRSFQHAQSTEKWHAEARFAAIANGSRKMDEAV